MIKVWVGKRSGGSFSGYWAEFEGEEIHSYENDDVVYTLYKATAYTDDAYRVHVQDERKNQAPVYELHPISRGSSMRGGGQPYSEPYYKEALAEDYPIFLRYVDSSRPRPVDPA